ncbi:MAG TPA: Crp/Fnr family transcriptional regulator [Rhodospirillales bacterium]|nr:Crp/Fnr family transcriptional regulator [Rhodospirillales bacterium]
MSADRDPLAGLAPFHTLEPACRERLRTAARLARLPAGSVLFRPGDRCGNWLVLAEGTVRVQLVDAEGHEIVLYRVGPGESCILTTACLLAGTDYEAEGIAETDIAGLMVPRGLFEEFLDRSAAFRRLVFASFAVRLADLMALVSQVAFARVDVRLAALLLDRGRGGSGVLELRHQDLAAELGTAREVVSRRLKDFERRGWVRLGRREIEIRDPAALSSLAAALR